MRLTKSKIIKEKRNKGQFTYKFEGTPEMTFEKALEAYKNGYMFGREAAEKCGMSPALFSKRAASAGIRANELGFGNKFITIIDETGKQVRVRQKLTTKPRKAQRGDRAQEYEKARLTSMMKGKYHSKGIEIALSEAKKLGLSYGKYVAMKKMGAIY